MTSLLSNLVKRIDRFPKPTNATGAMQPMFEAISNSIHATQERFSDRVEELGRVYVSISIKRQKSDVRISIEDNGYGLNKKNWEAFLTTDTDNKIEIGGKGVGRLLWLDCFERISIISRYQEGKGLKERKFDFVLNSIEQIKNESVSDIAEGENTSFFVNFSGLRSNGYLQKFPGRGSYIFQHLTSHFLPIFIGNRCPSIEISVGGEARVFPSAVYDIVIRREDVVSGEESQFGRFDLTLLECDKIASADMKGANFIHFIAHGRTVHSHCVDGLLGLKHFGPKARNVFHAVLTGKYLDNSVNQERTAFTFEDAVIERIIRDVCEKSIKSFLEAPLKRVDAQQKTAISSITETYPSVAFGDMSELQLKVPSGELSPDAIYGHLSRERFRRDVRQAEKIRKVLARLKEGGVAAEDFSAAIADASRAIEETEQKSLAEYVVRRKVVLDFIELLLEKVRDSSGDSAYQREDVLHSFICPMRVQTLNGGGKVEAASHDLWVVDERLTFAQYFSSDVDFETLSARKIASPERPDVLIFDYVHGLKQRDDPSKVLLMSLKNLAGKIMKKERTRSYKWSATLENCSPEDSMTLKAGQLN